MASSYSFQSFAWRDGVPSDEAPTGIEGIRGALADPDLLVWVDVVAPNPLDLVTLSEELDLDANTIEDAIAPHERPKASLHAGYTFFIAYATLPDFASTTGDEEDQLSRVAAFAFPNALITLRRTGAIDIEPVLQRWRANREVHHLGAAGLVHSLLDVIVDGFFDTVQELDDAIEDLEDDLFSLDSSSTGFQRRAYDVRTKLVTLRRIVLPMREIIGVLWRHREDTYRDLDPYYADLNDHVLRATEWTESLRDMIATVFETHLSLQDQRLNNVMKKLAGWAAVISIPTLVTGWFGQNVPYFGFGAPVGHLLSIALVTVPAIVVYILMRRNDWI